MSSRCESSVSTCVAASVQCECGVSVPVCDCQHQLQSVSAVSVLPMCSDLMVGITCHLRVVGKYKTALEKRVMYIKHSESFKADNSITNATDDASRKRRCVGLCCGIFVVR